MKLFNIQILMQKTLDKQIAEAKKSAIVIPNKMISNLLANQSEQPVVKLLLKKVISLQSEVNFRRVQNA